MKVWLNLNATLIVQSSGGKTFAEDREHADIKNTKLT